MIEKKKGLILVNKFIIGVSTDAPVVPSLCTHVGMAWDIESRLTTYNGSFIRVSLSVPTSRTTGRDLSGLIPARRLGNFG
jgi:hypothetical protein